MRAIGTLVLAIAVAGAAAEAKRGNEGGSVAIVDDGGNLMYLERLEPTFAMGARTSPPRRRAPRRSSSGRARPWRT
jgi:uncharacterized protein GlcG (DUF336 family)